MSNSNNFLNIARGAKNDEFYTQLEDIEKELKYYKEYLKNKVVLCNCDNPRISNFFRYFVINFNELQLKKVICVCYNSKSQNPLSNNISNENGIYAIFNGISQINKNTTKEEIDNIIKNIEIHKLKGNGDFRSNESINFLKESDVVITNPPFSLLRTFISQILEYNKKFLILGNMNTLMTKQSFSLIATQKMHFGYSIHSGGIFFEIPNSYKIFARTYKIDKITNKKYVRLAGIRWATNIEINNSILEPPKLFLTKLYNLKDYPHYDKFPNIINVDKTLDIPKDYTGLIGVPITFLDKWNKNQFDIIYLCKDKVNNAILELLPNEYDPKRHISLTNTPGLLHSKDCVIKDKILYYRIIIRRKG